MGQTYRNQKGAPLTFTEADSNWMFPFVWNVARQYSQGMITFDGTDFFYLCIQDVTTINTIALNNTSYWKRLAGVTSTSFSALLDVTLTSPKDGQVPRFNGTIWVNSDNVVTKTYSQLSTLKSGGNLIPGTFYKFTFQTKHIIDNTSTIHTGANEDLILLAITPNLFHKLAISASFGNDTVYYDFDNVLCEDGTTSRQGKIERRLTSVSAIDTPFDFRNVYSRRYALTAPAAWASVTSYTEGQLVSNGGSVYGCMSNHTSSSGFNTDFLKGYWCLIVYNYTTNKYQFSPSTTTAGIFTLPINMSDFVDTLAIDSSCSDITLQPSSLQPYLDIKLINCKSIKIYGNTYEITVLQNCTQINISALSSIIRIDQETNNVSISRFGQNIHIGRSASDTILAANNGNICIGSFSNSTTTRGLCSNVTIGSSAPGNTLLHLSYSVQIGGFSVGNTIYSTGCKLYGKCSNNNILYTSFTSTYDGIILNDGCSYNDILNSITTVLGLNCSYNKIKNSPALTLRDNSYHNEFNDCLAIVYASGKYTRYSKYNKMQNKTFSDNISAVSFLVSNVISQTIANAYSDIVVDKNSPDGNMWYDSIDNFGDLTSNKIV